MNKPYKPILLFLLLSFFTASCGDGSSQVASGGIGGTGISQGTIDGFGSIILNGVTFNTDGSTFTVDDNPGAQNDLAVGMQVTVQVDATGTTATAVVSEPEVKGPLDTNTAATNTLVVLGRTVVIDDTTKIEDDATPPATLTQAQLNNNNMLEASGLVLADGSIQATYIKRKNGVNVAPPTLLKLKGTVSGFTGGTTFTIGTQTIDFSGITPLAFTLANDQLVQVKGTRGGVGTSMLATEVKNETGALGANAGFKVEIEGAVTTFTTTSDFSVGDQAVITSASTTFEDGAQDDIEENVRLEVEGTIDANGVLVASKVKFHGNRIKIEADVSTKGTSPNSLTLLGKAVIINGLTEMRDSLSFSTITTDRLELRGYLSGSVVTATRVRLGNPGEITLQAPVEAISGTDLTLLGNTVTTAGAAFSDIDGSSLTSEQFFAKVSAGTVVKIKAPSGTNMAATEVEIED